MSYFVLPSLLFTILRELSLAIFKMVILLLLRTILQCC